MKKLICLILLFCSVPNLVLADCDFAVGIKKTDHNTFEYSYDCHIAVGQMKQDLSIAKKQINDLSQAIKLKDLAINYSDQRGQLWQDTSLKMQDRITKIDELQSKNYFMYFGLGILSTIGVGLAVAKLAGK